METISTKYGILRGVSFVSIYPGGSIQECIPLEPNKLKTPYGNFIPQHSDDGERRKSIKPLSFYQNGSLKSISLQNQVPVKTSLGVLPAEMITFYDNGAIKRIFPLDGKLSGFWGEEDEYALAEDIEFKFPFGKFKQKVIGIRFYNNGSVQSITFWTKDTLEIQSPAGPVTVRIGLSLYPDGKIKSFEPAKPTPVETPIGRIIAYDKNALGIHGDCNSVSFGEDGKIEGIITSSNAVEVIDKNGKNRTFQPSFKRITAGYSEFVPLSIEFLANKVRFNQDGEQEYSVEGNAFSIKPFIFQSGEGCFDCSSCSGCG